MSEDHQGARIYRISALCTAFGWPGRDTQWSNRAPSPSGGTHRGERPLSKKAAAVKPNFALEWRRPAFPAAPGSRLAR